MESKIFKDFEEAIKNLKDYSVFIVSPDSVEGLKRDEYSKLCDLFTPTPTSNWTEKTKGKYEDSHRAYIWKDYRERACELFGCNELKDMVRLLEQIEKDEHSFISKVGLLMEACYEDGKDDR